MVKSNNSTIKNTDYYENRILRLISTVVLLPFIL